MEMLDETGPPAELWGATCNRNMISKTLKLILYKINIARD